LHNAILKISERRVHVQELLGATPEEFNNILVESFLGFCQMTRLCGDSNDLLLALSKTGFLEQKFAHSEQFPGIYTAVLAERADILWSRRETTEAVQTLRSLLASSQDVPLSFALVPKEIVLAKLVHILT
jgi:hypothetical protein